MSRWTSVSTMLCGSTLHHDHDVVAAAFGEHQGARVRGMVEVELAQLLQCRVFPADLDEPPEQQVEVLTTLGRRGPVPGPILELLGLRYSSRPCSAAFSNSSKPE